MIDSKTLSLAMLVLVGTCSSAEELPIKIAEIKRETPVDFAKEVYPLIKQNCLACHHAKEAEGGLNLESHSLMLTGGDSGPAVKPKDVAASLLLTRATGEEELMPPEDNEVGAKTLTPEQLGLIKLWIEQGAIGGDIAMEPEIQWQPIPETMRMIYALDISPDDRFVACGRGNRVSIYDMTTSAEVAKLVDPTIEPISGPNAADVDMVQAIAFSPDGTMIATGGFRSVRLWKKVIAKPESPASTKNIAGLKTTNRDQTQIAFVNAIGDIEICNTDASKSQFTLKGHEDQIAGLAWSTDADRLFSCDVSGAVYVWQPSTGKRLGEFPTGTNLQSLMASADGNTVAALTSDHKVRILRVAAQTVEGTPDAAPLALMNMEMATITAITDASAIAIVNTPSPFLLIGTGAGAKVIGLGDGKLIRTINHGGAVTAVTATQDSKVLITGGADGKTKTWKSENGEAIRTFQGDTKSFLRIATAQRDSARQKALVTRLEAKTAEVEKALATENEAVKKVKEAHDKAVAKVTEEEKKRIEAAAKVTATEAAINKANSDKQASDNKLVEVQRLISQQEAEKKTVADQVAAAKAARDKAATVLAEEEKKLKEINDKIANLDASLTKAKQEVQAKTKLSADLKTKSDALAKQLETEKKAAETATNNKKKSDDELVKKRQALAAANSAQQRAAAVVPKHKSLIEAQKRRGELLEKELVTVQQLQSSPNQEVVSIAVSADGAKVASVHRSGAVRTYSTVSGRALSDFEADAVSETGTTMLSFWNKQLCLARRNASPDIWSLQSDWKVIRTIGSPTTKTISDRATALDFRRDGQSIAVGSGPPSRFGEVKVFAVATGELVRDFGEIHSDTVLGLKFSPDGRKIASSAADKTVRLLDVSSGEIIRSLEGHTHHVLSLAWEDTGETVATASADQSLKVWNIETGGQRRTINGFGKEITAISFVQQSPQVVTACADGQVRLHDTRNGKSIRSFNAAGDFLFGLAVSGDGKTLAAGGQSGTLRIWNVADGKQIHEVK